MVAAATAAAAAATAATTGTEPVHRLRALRSRRPDLLAEATKEGLPEGPLRVEKRAKPTVEYITTKRSRGMPRAGQALLLLVSSAALIIGSVLMADRSAIAGSGRDRQGVGWFVWERPRLDVSLWAVALLLLTISIVFWLR